MQTSNELSARNSFLAATVVTLTLICVGILIWTAPQPTIDAARQAITWFADREDRTGRAIATTILATLAAMAYVFAWAKTVSPRRAVEVGNGYGTIPVEELAAVLRSTILEQPDVCEAIVRVDNLHHKGLRVSLILDVTPEAQLADTASYTASQVENSLRERSGLELSEPPAIKLRYGELILKRSKHTLPPKVPNIRAQVTRNVD